MFPFLNFGLEFSIVFVTGNDYQVVSQIGVFWNLKGVEAIGVPTFSASGEVFRTEHLEPFIFMHVRDGIFPASRRLVMTKRKNDWIFLPLFLIGVENLFWMTTIIHFGCIMNSYPVKWLTESTKRLAVCLSVLMNI